MTSIHRQQSVVVAVASKLGLETVPTKVELVRGKLRKLAAARYEKLCARLREFQLGAVADLGFVGLDDGGAEQPTLITRFKASGGQRLSTPKKIVNRLVSSLPAPVEHGFASLKTFRILTKVRMQPAARDRAGAGPAGTDPSPGRAVTNDLPATITAVSCPSTPTAHHTRAIDVHESR